MIALEHTKNTKFQARRPTKLPSNTRKDSHQPRRSAEADVREMLIQHILTEEIFSQGVRRPRVSPARTTSPASCTRWRPTFFTGALTRRDTLNGLGSPITPRFAPPAQLISRHSARSRHFLKVIYENFYKVYNAESSRPLGVVYTPNEIVKLHDRGRRLAVPETF
jgi:type I restriction-modification system DNA methylase subunit